MATQITPDTQTLRREVQIKYTEVAENPENAYHFHHGRPLAQILGYEMEQVDAMPPQAVESFAGVGNPFSVGAIQPGETVMDVGSGCGFDCFIAGQATGPQGKVIGVDMTEAMLVKSRATAQGMSMDHLEFRRGYIEELPVADATVDVAISNGVINLSHDKYAVFQEIYRTLKPGGRLHLADIVVHKDVPGEARADVDLWTA